MMKHYLFIKLKSMISLIVMIAIIGILCPLLMIELAVYVSPNLIPDEIRMSIFQAERPILPKDATARVMVLDGELGYKYAPDLVNYNNISFEGGQHSYTISTVPLGYNNVGFRDDGLNGEPFAIVVGDSFANCMGVEMDECWVELLERSSQRDFANLSVMGYSPQQEYLVLTKYGLPLKPKLILWVFFANDLKDAWRFDKFGSGGARETEFWQNPIQAWLAQNSAVYIILSFFWYNDDFFYDLVKVGNDVTANMVWWSAQTDLSATEVGRGFELTQDVILKANRQSRAQDIESRFIVVIIPFREQVYASTEWQDQFNRQLNEPLVEFLQRNGIIVIDLTDELREQTRNQLDPLYFEQDIHLNINGNKIVAKLLKEKLKEITIQ